MDASSGAAMATGSTGGLASAATFAATSGGLTINLQFDSAAMAAPQSFRDGIEQAASLIAAALADRIVVNINVHYSGTGGVAHAGPDGGQTLSYRDVRTRLINGAAPDDTFFQTLPDVFSIDDESSVVVTNAQLKVFGLLGATAATDDGGAVFATDINPNLLVGVALHELTHALGRVPSGPVPNIFDLFRFTAPLARLFDGSGSSAPPAYFSLDNGVTKLADYGQHADTSDFLNSGIQGSTDPFNEFYTPNTSQTLTSVDLKQLDALGFHLAGVRQRLSITGTVADQRLTDTRTIMPFSSVVLTGSYSNSLEFVTIKLRDSNQTITDANGRLSGGGLSGGGGNYQLIGSPDTVTSEIEQLVFTPTANEIAPGNVVRASVEIDLSEAPAGGMSQAPVSNTATTILVTSVDDPPTITGWQFNQPTDDRHAINPFSTITIDDVDRPPQSISLDIQLDDPHKGTLSNLGGGTYSAVNGDYGAYAPSTDLTNWIRGLVFTPTPDRQPAGTTETTAFTITIREVFFSRSVVASVATTFVDDPPQITSDGGGDSADLEVEQGTTAVTVVAATDPNPGATLGFSISGGADAALFTIDPKTGALSFLSAPAFNAPKDADHNNLYVVEVAVSDGTLSDHQTLNVAVGKVLAEPGAMLAELSPADIRALPGEGFIRLDATDDALSLTVAQYQALGPVRLTAGDAMALADTGANLATLSPAAIATLAGKGIDRLDATDDALTLTLAQFQALGTVTLTASDTVTLTATGAALGGMSLAAVAALAGKGIDRFDATDDVLFLSLAGLQALGTVALTPGDVVTLYVFSLDFVDLSPVSLASIAAKGIDRIDSTDFVLPLSVAQYLALGSMVFAPDDVVTLVDTGANIASLSAADFALLAGKNVDKIDAVPIDNVLALSVAQYQALGAVTIAPNDVVILADTGTALGALSVSSLAGLTGRRVSRIDATDDALRFSLAQLQSLGPVALTAGDFVTLADTGATLGGLTPAAFAALASQGIDALDATDDKLTLSLAQFQALGAVQLAAGDTVTLADSGAALAALPPATLAGLAGRGIDVLDATDDVLVLNVAQALALGSVTLAAADLVTLGDSGAQLGALSATDIAALAGKGVDALDATDDVLVLTVAQLKALGPIKLSAADVVTLADSGAAIAGLTALQIGALAAFGIDRIDATDDSLSLSLAQLQALGTVVLTTADVVTLADTGATLAGLSAGAIAALAGKGIDRLDATDDLLTLSLAQVQALGTVTLSAGDVVTVTATGAVLGGLSPAGLAALAAEGIDRLDVTDNVLILNVAQYLALGPVVCATADLVTLADTGANLAALSAASIGALASHGIDRIDATDNVLTLNVAQAVSLGTVALTAADGVTLADTGAHLRTLTATQIAALAKGVDVVDATDNVLTLSVAQYQALGMMALTASDVVTLADTGANLAALSATAFAAMAGKGIDRIDATDDALTLTLPQFQALGTVMLTAADVVILTASSSALGGLSTASLAALAGLGIDRIDATNDLLTLNLAQLQALGTVALTAADFVTLADTGANLAALPVATIAGLAGKGIDRINVSDNALSLTLAQFQALGAVALTPSNVVTLVGSSTTLGALSVPYIGALAGKGIDRLDSNNDLLTLNVAQAQALGPVALTAADLVTLADTSATLAALAPTAIAALASKGFDRIHVIDGPLTLNVAQVQALGAMVLASADLVVLADTGATLAALPPAIIAGLAAKGIDRIGATDNVLTFNVAQALALGTVALTASDMVTLADTGNHLKALTAAQIAVLAKSIDFMDATDNVLTLSLAQYQALGAMVLAATDVVTIADTGAALAGMSTSGFAPLAGKGVDRLDATDDALTLTLAQYQALGAVTLTAADVVTLKASPSAIIGLGISGLAALAGKGIDVIDSSTDVLTLNVAQYLALGPVICAAADVVTVADTGANLAGMPLANFAALAGHGIDRIDATDNLLTLSAAQAVALGPVALTAADLITLADTGANLGGIPASVFATLATNGADRMDATDNTLILSVAQFQALGGIALTAADMVTLADTGATLTALSPAAIAALPGKGIDGLDATDNQLSLSLAQYQALGPLTLAAADVVTLTDTGTALANLSLTDLAALAGRGIDRLDSTTDALTLSVAQYVALGPVVLAAGDVVTLADTGANLGALSVANIAALAGHGIDRIDASDGALSLSLAQFNALGTTALSADDALTLTGTADSDTIGFTSQPFNVHDRIDGGLGTDTLTLAGDYSTGLAFEAGTITNVERLLLSGGNSYKFTMADANIAAGQTLIVNASKLGAADSLVFDGSAETNGKFSLVGGAGSTSFTGGNGGDSITAGAGADLIRYTAASQSTSTGYDTVAGFDAAKDKFQVPGGVAAVDPTIATGKLSMASFDADLAAAANAAHLLASHAALFTPDSGALAGSQFLVVDANGVAGYQAGSDVVVRLTGATNLGSFGSGNFV